LIERYLSSLYSTKEFYLNLKKTVLYRVVLIGKLSNQNRIDLGEYYDKLFKNMQNDSKASPYQEKVTGLIILYPTIMIHCVEVILDYLRCQLN
jgi:hypothetical protein